ncbi:Alpha/Beta hydrolase protein, partial [Lipomyces oligophaga]|uniref:Alpha/Beta hydrolase protein n=1 Tax=Lipomyces oligophaga TaxID=45792 RepID=UPI0034CE0D55
MHSVGLSWLLPHRPRSLAYLLGFGALYLVLFVADFVAASSSESAKDFYVSSLPGAPSSGSPRMYAGHIEIKPEHNGNIFFWMFENEHIAEKQRTVIWLNGGPGCSSMDGAMMEVGPYRVNKDGTLYFNEGRWNQYSNMLFVDNPIGTGFSYVDTDSYLHELDEMTADFLTFMDKFFSIFPQYLADDLYIAGESYAGTYIPYIAQAILDRNSNSTSTDVRYPLKGILLGNGWIDPVRQYLSYAPFAYQNGLIKSDSTSARKVDAQIDKCVKDLSDNGVRITVDSCEGILDIILEESKLSKAKDNKVCYNMYDVRKFDTYPDCGSNWPEDLESVTPYLRTDEIKAALHINVNNKPGWSECSGAVSREFTAKRSKPTVDLLPGILEQIPVLMFNGDQDMICNHLGNEDLIGKMSWSGATGFEEAAGGAWAPRLPWTYDGEPVGLYQTARNLTYVLVYNASHMVPVDQPLAARDMFHRFLGVDFSHTGEVSKGVVGDDNSTTPSDDNDNDSSDQKDENDKIKDAMRAAYFRAGELALVIVSLAALGFAAFLLYQRRVARLGGYRTVGFAKQDTMIRLEDGTTTTAAAAAAFGDRNSSSTTAPARAVSNPSQLSHGEDNELDELVVESPLVTSDEMERRLVYQEPSSRSSDELGSESEPSLARPLSVRSSSES